MNRKAKSVIRLIGKQISIVMVIFLVLLIFSGCFEDNIVINSELELIRIHIRANSDSQPDQAVKLEVRDVVTQYLSQWLDGVLDRRDAYNALVNKKAAIKGLCDETLERNGFSYRSTLKINNEYFPTRQYENIIVESGFYDALIIELGEGEGSNWWCVIYPPLCYLGKDGGETVKYKSKIKELIDKYF